MNRAGLPFLSLGQGVIRPFAVRAKSVTLFGLIIDEKELLCLANRAISFLGFIFIGCVSAKSTIPICQRAAVLVNRPKKAFSFTLRTKRECHELWRMLDRAGFSERDFQSEPVAAFGQEGE
jgi:hypothetical protein